MRRILGAILLCALAMPARAQMESREGIQLQNQILELRHDLQILQSQMQGGAPPPTPYYPQARDSGGGGGELTAQLLQRVQALEDEMRRLRGRLDEQDNNLQQMHDDLSKQIADLQFRLQNGGAGAPPLAPAAPSLAPSPGPGPQPSSLGTVPGAPNLRRPPELAMQEGNAALARRDYAAAEAAAREVLAAGRNAPRAADANFLLAQAMMGQRNYQAAAVSYDDAYNRSRTGSRAPEALLGLANALTGLDERPSACATLDKLHAEFPSLRPDVREAAAALRARNGCH